MRQLTYALLMGAALVAAPLAAGAQDVVWKTQGVSKDEIVLGIHADLSGPAAIFGTPVVNAFRMRIDDANAAGGINGRKIKLIVEDNQYQVPRAVQAVGKLINSDQVFAVIGATGTPMNAAAIPAQMKAGVPNLFPISWGSSMVEPLSPLKWGVYTNYTDQIRGVVKYMVQGRGKKAVCAMYQDNDYGREVYQAAVQQLKLMKMELVASSPHRPTDTDFTVAINKFREAKCDLVVMGTIVRDAIVPYTAARKMGWNDVDFVGSSGSYDGAIAAAEGGATEGFYAVGFFDEPVEATAGPEASAWIEHYRLRYSAEPTIPAAVGYTIMDLALGAIQRAGPDLTTKSLVAALEQTSNVKDIFGGNPHSLSATQHFTSRASVLYKVQNRRWIRVAPVPEP